MALEDLYRILEVPPTASEIEIREAFAKQFAIHGIELGTAADGNLVRELLYAKATLINPISRSAYESGGLIDLHLQVSQPGAPQWIIVCSEGLGQFSSIKSAVESASDGDKIYVLPGLYRETLITVDKALEIVGQSSPGQEVIIEVDQDGMYLEAEGSFVRGLSIRTTAEAGIGVIAAAVAGAVLTDCHFSGPGGTGVLAADGALVVHNCVFEGCRHGVRIDRGHAGIVGSRFLSGITGVLMRGGGDCVLEGNEFSELAAAGIEAQSDTIICASRNRFERCQAGVAVEKRTRGTIRHNRFVGLAENAAVFAVDGDSIVDSTDNTYV